MVRTYADRLSAAAQRVAIVALTAYGRQQLTPHADVDVLFLTAATDNLPLQVVTEAICYPLWEQGVRIEAIVRSPGACAADARRSVASALTFLDARLVVGDQHIYTEFTRQVVQPWRRDKKRLRSRLAVDVQRRHATHAATTHAGAPDIVSGRGGLLDLQGVRWLRDAASDRDADTLDLLLRVLTALEERLGRRADRLSVVDAEVIASHLGYPNRAALLRDVYAHARDTAFHLESALAPERDERALGLGLAIHNGMLTAERLPPLARVPPLGLRIATMVGLAPPDAPIVTWACRPGPAVIWDDATREQFFLLLRAADWRAWDFLDVTGLLDRYIPELQSVRRVPGAGPDEVARDTHTFTALRRIHEWSDSGDPSAERAWRPLRRRDWLYVAILLHDLEPAVAHAAAERIGLPDEACDVVAFVAGHHRVLDDTATRRDVNDEDALIELATRIRTQQRLCLLFLVTVAHDLALGGSAWSAWKADLLRQLLVRLDSVLRQTSEVGTRRARSLEGARNRVSRELERRDLAALVPLVARLPRRYVLTQTPTAIARHLALLRTAPLGDGEVRLEAHPHRHRGWWSLRIVARDRPGLLATVAGVIALRGASTMSADAATSSDGLVLDVFTVSGLAGSALERERVTAIAADLQAALAECIPLADLLGVRPLPPEDAAAIRVTIDNTASKFFSIVEVRAPDLVGLLYRIANSLHELGLDIHHARIATHPEGAVDVFYVWDLSGAKLDDEAADTTAMRLTARLRGEDVR
ncbi:MAG: [protein-PII] uridylyltransferase [Chloroflexota bacterium]